MKLISAIKTVSWAFLGIRGDDTRKVSEVGPAYLLVASILLLLAFIGALILLVKLVAG